MDQPTAECENTNSLGHDVGAAFLTSAAASAGLFAGMAVFGTLVDFAKKRKAKKNPTPTTEQK